MTTIPRIVEDVDGGAAMVIHAGTIARWIEQDPDQAVERLEKMNQILELLRAASMKATYPSDWIIHVSRDREGAIISQRGYLQDIGVERAAKIWGLQVSEPVIERVPASGLDGDGHFEYRLMADAWSRATGERVENVIGARSSGDKFFRRGLDPDDKDDQIDPTDVLKAAYANLHGRAGRALMGLGGVPLDVLERGGIDIKKVVMVDYEKGGKGGESTGASTGGSADVVMAFGKAKGKKVSELVDADLAWYLSVNEKDLADPGKEKYRKNTERTLKALRDEQERRTRKAEHEEATGKDEPVSSGARITAAEVTAFWATAKAKGWEKAELGQLLAEIGAAAVDQIPRDAWDVVKATLERGPVRA